MGPLDETFVLTFMAIACESAGREHWGNCKGGDLVSHRLRVNPVHCEAQTTELTSARWMRQSTIRRTPLTQDARFVFYSGFYARRCFRPNVQGVISVTTLSGCVNVK